MRYAISLSEKSHILKHWMRGYPELNHPPPFRLKVLISFKDCLSHQLSEAISIMMTEDNLLNSENEYLSNCISKITIEEGAMERKLRERNEEMKEKAEAEELLNFKEMKFKLLAAPVDKRKGDIQPPGTGEDKENENDAKKRRVESKSSGMEANNLRRRMETERNWKIQRMDSWKLENILEDLATWWMRMETWSGRNTRELEEIEGRKDRENKRKAKSTCRMSMDQQWRITDFAGRDWKQNA
jgi:hypothetical protein